MDGTEVSEQGDIAQNGEIEAVPQNEEVSAEIEGAPLNESETSEAEEAQPPESTPEESVVAETPVESAAEETNSVIAETPGPSEQASTLEVPEVAGAPAGEEPAEELDGASLMEQYLSDPSHDYKTLKYGDVVDGVIMRIDRDEL